MKKSFSEISFELKWRTKLKQNTKQNKLKRNKRWQRKKREQEEQEENECNKIDKRYRKRNGDKEWSGKWAVVVVIIVVVEQIYLGMKIFPLLTLFLSFTFQPSHFNTQMEGKKERKKER